MALILIIEDNDKNRKLVRDVLQASGHRTLEAVSAEDGLKMARTHNPELVLMDIELPGMNGIDALKALRDDPQSAHLQVIAITASVMQQDRQHIMRAGFDGFIENPISLKRLYEAVAEGLAGRRA